MSVIKNIVLTGFMMAGKTVIGHELAEITGYEFIDTDEMIVESEKRAISDIFSENGEEYFRNVESEIAKIASVKENTIISTGGGLVLRKENLVALRKNGIIVNLKITPEVIKKRLEHEKATRPIIKDLDFNGVLEKYNSRKHFYKDCDVMITVSNKKTPREHAEEILKILNGNGEI